MKVYAQKQSKPQQQASGNISRSSAQPLAASHRVHPILYLQRTIGNQAVQRLLQANAEAPEADSDTSATTRFAHDFSRITVSSEAPVPLQAEFMVDTPGDIYEREADHISERVMRMPEPKLQCACGGRCPTCQKGHQLLQTKSAPTHTAGGMTAPPIVHEVLQSDGQPLDSTTAKFFAERLGHDFRHVRVHTDSRAAESARAVNALAYTVGQEIVFGAGQFSPQSTEGKRLVAHELTHVVQQTTSKESDFRLQRTPDKEPKKAPDKEPKRMDVVLLGEGVIGGGELARVLAPGGKIISVKSMSDAVAALSKIDVPIRTLYFITHSLADGALQFGKSEGFVKPDDIAKKVTGSVPTDKAPQNVDFRGCSVGTSPKAMNQIRGALGAKSVVAGNCYVVIQKTTPVKVGDKEITKASDVTEENRPIFEKYRTKTVNRLGPGKKCILNNSDKGFFAMGGKYVALWFNTSLSKEWKKDESVCYKDINPQTVDPNKALAASKGCHLIRVEGKP